MVEQILDTIVLINGENFDESLIKKFKDGKIFVFDLLSHKIIQNNDLEHFFADDLLNKKEREKIFDHVVSKLYWYETLFFPDISMTDSNQIFKFLDPLYLHQKLLVSLIHFTIIKKILQVEKPKKIFATENLSKIIISIDNEIPIILLNSEQTEIFDKFDFRITLFSKIISLKISMKWLRKLQNLYESIVGSLYNLWLDTKSKKPIILLLEFEPSKFPKLLEKLNSEKFDCVVLNRRKSPILNYNSIKILKKSNTRLINFQKLLSKKEKNEIDVLTQTYENSLKNFWENEKRLHHVFSYENSSYFPYIKDFLKKQFNSEMKSNVEILIQSKYIFKNFNVKCILYQYESGASENIILSQRNDVPSLLMRHGFSSFSEKFDNLRWKYDQFRLLKLDCDEIILWGDSDFNFYSKFLTSGKKLQKIGSPRHDAFFHHLEHKNKLKKTILITTPPIIEWTGQQNINLELRYEQVLKQLIKTLQKNPDFKLIGKLHPAWGWTFNRTLMKIFHDIDPNIPVYSTKSIIELIAQCDLMININPEENQPSTVLLEGLIMKKPVINIELDELNDDLDYDDKSPIISLSFKSNIEHYISEYFENSLFTEKLNSQSEKALRHYLSNHNNASVALAKYLKSFI